MSNLFLFNGESMIELTKKMSLHLELELNKSEFSNKWSNLGDILYCWGTQYYYVDNYSHGYKNFMKKNKYEITKEQYNWITKQLLTYCHEA